MWEQLRAPELKKLAEKNAVVMIPMGAVEQHGPHLPVATDTILAQWIAERAAKEMWDKGIPVVIAPAFVIANSMHHMHFSGSLSLTPGTFIQVLKEQCRAIAVQGFRKIAIINGHGGNTAPIDVALIDINQELGFPVYNVPYTAGVDESPFLDKQNYMIHSGEVETSLILSYDESLVDTSYTNLSGNPGGCSDYEGCGASPPSITWKATLKTELWEKAVLPPKKRGLPWRTLTANALWKYSPTKDYGVSLYDGF